MVTPAFVDDDTIAVMTHNNPVAITMAPAVVMAAVLLDHDGLRAGGLRRQRQSDANGGKSSKGQDNLAHASFSSGVNIASTREDSSRSNFSLNDRN